MFIGARDTKKSYNVYMRNICPCLLVQEIPRNPSIKILKNIPYYGHFKFIKAQFKSLESLKPKNQFPNFEGIK